MEDFEAMTARKTSRGTAALGKLFLCAAFGGCMLVAAAASASADESAHRGKAHAGRVSTPPGVSIRLLSPQDGATFEMGKPIQVKVRAEGLKASGNHWHLYVDGELEAMVGGGRTDYELSGKEPGEHELEVTMSNANHQEYDIDDRVTIVLGPPSSGAAGSTTIPK
jgi:hypothetical protein